MKKALPIEQLERASRLYKKSREAARALGISEQHYTRLCRKHNIETPYRRQQRLRRQAKRLDRPHETKARQAIVQSIKEQKDG